MNGYEKQALLNNLNNVQKKLASIKYSHGSPPYICPDDKARLEALSFYKDKAGEHLYFHAQPDFPQSSMSAKSIPYGEILKLIKDMFNGKLNQHLQAILDSAKIQLSVKRNDPNDECSPEHLEIKIDMAAAVINRYADLLKMMIGENITETDKIVKDTATVLSDASEKVNNLNMILGIRQLANATDCEITKHKDKHCHPFFCLGKSIIKYKELSLLFNQLAEHSLSTNEFAGALYTLKQQIDVFPKSIKTLMLENFDKILTMNGFPIDDQDIAVFFMHSFSERASAEHIEWPKPYRVTLNQPAPNASMPTAMGV